MIDIKELQELVKFLKDNKIFSFKKGDLELQFSQLAFVPETQVVDIIKESEEQVKLKEIIENSKTSIEEIQQTSKEFETSTSTPNKDPICGAYTEDELFR